MDEKKKFAERLREAMIAAGYEPRPSVLEKQFNARYWGRSVTLQATRRWLVGLSIPEQDKLQVLAEWLGIEPHVLRFGVRNPSEQLSEPRLHWAAGMRPQDREAIDLFLALSPDHRKVVRDIIHALKGERGTGSRGKSSD